MSWTDDGGRPLVDATLASVVQQQDYESTALLTDEQKVAVRYADAHMVDPQRIDGVLRDQLHRQYDRHQIVQLSLEVSAWNHQKVLVPLALDIPISTECLTAMTFGPDGDYRMGDSLS